MFKSGRLAKAKAVAYQSRLSRTISFAAPLGGAAFHKRLVGQHLKRVFEAREVGQALHHEHPQNVFLRIDPEGRSRCAAQPYTPRELTVSVCGGSITTETPRPKPRPRRGRLAPALRP